MMLSQAIQDTTNFASSASDTLIVRNPQLLENAYYVVFGWIILVAVMFLAMLLWFTFGLGFRGGKENPYQGETFAMPRGVFRGTLTLSLLFLVMLIEIIHLNFGDAEIGDSLFIPEERFKELMVAFQMMLAFYFGSKVMHHLTKADERKSMASSEALKAAAVLPEVSSAPSGGEFDQPGSVG